MERTDSLPAMLFGDELLSQMAVFPNYHTAICEEDAPIRLESLSDIYDVYVPSANMSAQIYSKLYLITLRAFQKKKAVAETACQQAWNRNHIRQGNHQGLLGGIDSTSIIGVPNVGKSRSIGRAISLITDDRLIELDHPYRKVIPILQVQSQQDASIKGLLLEILRQISVILDSGYYEAAIKTRATVDGLIGMAAQALQQVCVLVIDECQSIFISKNARNTVACLLQLINQSRCSLVFVGTPDCLPYIESVPYLARRMLGLQYGPMPYDEHFKRLCQILLSYRYVKDPIVITDAITQFLYEHSAGLVGNVMSMVHDCQEIAIISGTETVSIETLTETYLTRMKMLHGYIEVNKPKVTLPSKLKHTVFDVHGITMPIIKENLFSVLGKQAKEDGLDIVEMLKRQIIVEEIQL